MNVNIETCLWNI